MDSKLRAHKRGLLREAEQRWHVWGVLQKYYAEHHETMGARETSDFFDRSREAYQDTLEALQRLTGPLLSNLDDPEIIEALLKREREALAA